MIISRSTSILGTIEQFSTELCSLDESEGFSIRLCERYFGHFTSPGGRCSNKLQIWYGKEIQFNDRKSRNFSFFCMYYFFFYICTFIKYTFYTRYKDHKDYVTFIYGKGTMFTHNLSICRCRLLDTLHN